MNESRLINVLYVLSFPPILVLSDVALADGDDYWVGEHSDDPASNEKSEGTLGGGDGLRGVQW